MSEHTCHKCDRPNPYADVPESYAYQRLEAALAVHRLLWKLNDVYRIDRFLRWLNSRLTR